MHDLSGEQLMPLRHIVLFRVYADAPASTVEKAITTLMSLETNVPGLLEYRVERSLDERKGIVIVENALFESRTALRLFRESEEHQAVSEILKGMSDWWIGDYSE